jgi:hypothetical protein
MIKRRNKMTKNEYKRKVFNLVLSESFSMLYAHVAGLDENINETTTDEEVVKRISYVNECKEVFGVEMGLNESTISKTKEKIEKHGSSFAKKLCVLAEAIADAKAEFAPVEDLEENTPVEIGTTEEEVISSIFEEELDLDNVNVIRDRVAGAIHSEKIRIEELKTATSLEEKQSKDGTLSEATMSKLNAAPQSILESIYKGAIGKLSRDNLLSENTDINLMSNPVIIDAVKEAAENTYAIYECIGGFGFRGYDETDAKRLISKYYKLGYK